MQIDNENLGETCPEFETIKNRYNFLTNHKHHNYSIQHEKPYVLHQRHPSMWKDSGVIV